MRKSKFSDEQMVQILREADRSDVSTAAKRHGISDQTIYIWRKRFGYDARRPSMHLRAKQHAEEALADRSLDPADAPAVDTRRRNEAAPRGARAPLRHTH